MHDTASCVPANEVLARIGEKWTVLVVVTLASGSQRFTEIKRSLNGVSQRMLTITLRNLERDGLISRTVTPTIPPRVDYALTGLGQSLCAPVMALGRWAVDNHPTIVQARARFDELSAPT